MNFKNCLVRLRHGWRKGACARALHITEDNLPRRISASRFLGRSMIACCALVLAMSMVRSVDFTSYRLPITRFDGWSMLHNEATPRSIDQVGRKPLSDLPHGADGYAMVTYLVETCTNDAAARQRIVAHQQQYLAYSGQGYRVEKTDWSVKGHTCTLYDIGGVDSHVAEGLVAHTAEVYTYAETRDNVAIWFEIRYIATASDQSTADHAVQRAKGKAAANDWITEIIDLWTPAVNPITLIATSTPPAATQGLPIANTAQPSPSTTPANAPLQTPAGTPYWRTPDGHLAFPLPSGYTMSATPPYTLSGLSNVTLRVYPATSFTDAGDLTAATNEFTNVQSAISRGGFTTAPFLVDGANGMQVRYTNYDKHTIFAYEFGKAGRLWRIDVEFPTANAQLPDAVHRILGGILVN